MHITHFESGTLLGESTGTHRGRGAQVLHCVEHVSLLHELRKLIGCEKFFEARLEGARRNEVDGENCVGLNGRHTVLNIALHLCHTNTELCLEHFPNITHATASEVIDIILLSTLGVIQLCNIGDRGGKVVEREHSTLKRLLGHIFSKSAIETNTTDRRKVIALTGKHCVDKFASVGG